MALSVLVDGLAFAEGLRWRDGQLWFSDMHDDSVWRVSEDGTRHRVCDVTGSPSGLGWLPGGELLIVSMLDRKLLKLGADGKLTDYADLSGVAPRRTNDMIVDEKGRAYVGNFGFDFDEDEPQATTSLALVTQGGQVSAAGKDLLFPNGMVITADGSTLIVAETFAACLTAFDIDDARQSLEQALMGQPERWRDPRWYLHRCGGCGLGGVACHRRLFAHQGRRRDRGPRRNRTSGDCLCIGREQRRYPLHRHRGVRCARGMPEGTQRTDRDAGRRCARGQIDVGLSPVPGCPKLAKGMYGGDVLSPGNVRSLADMDGSWLGD